MGDDPNQQGNSRRWITRAVEDSLRRLQTDYIDLYQIHRPAPDTDIEETLSALTDLMRAGKVRAIGSSTFPASDIVEAQWVAERRGLARFRTEQPPYSILNRGIEREVLPACQRYGMGVMAWSPLAKGMLTGKYRKGQPQPDTLRAKYFPKAMSDEAQPRGGRAAHPAGGGRGLSLTHMALAFVMAHPGVTSAIIGPRTMEHLDDLLAGAEVIADDELLDRIDEIVPPGVDVAPLEGAAYTPPAITQARCAAARSPSGRPPDVGDRQEFGSRLASLLRCRCLVNGPRHDLKSLAGHGRRAWRGVHIHSGAKKILGDRDGEDHHEDHADRRKDPPAEPLKEILLPLRHRLPPVLRCHRDTAGTSAPRR